MNNSSDDKKINGLCHDALSAYIGYLKERFELGSTERGCLLVAPMERSDGEPIELEILSQIDGVIITDNGETLGHLWLHGLNINSRGVVHTINRIATRYDIKIDKQEIRKFSTQEMLGTSLYSFIAAVQDISYLIYKVEFRGRPTFDEEVEKFFIAQEISYETKYEIEIKPNIPPYTFHFYINSRRNALVQTLTATSATSAYSKAERLAYRWVDVKEYKPHYRRITVIEDTGKKQELWEPRSLDILGRRSDNLVKWSQRELLANLLKSSS